MSITVNEVTKLAEIIVKFRDGKQFVEIMHLTKLVDDTGKVLSQSKHREAQDSDNEDRLKEVLGEDLNLAIKAMISESLNKSK